MKQKNQIKILLLFCVLVLIGLISIQAALIKSAFQLQKRDYISEVKTTITPVIESDYLEDLQDSLSNIIIRLEDRKIKGTISAPVFKNELKDSVAWIRTTANDFIRQQAVHYPVLNDIKLCFEYTEVVYSSNNTTDTIVRLQDSSMVYFGERLATNDKFNLISGNYYSRNNNTDDTTGINYLFTRKHAINVDFGNWERVVVLRMWGMLTSAFVLILAVIIVFFFMYSILIKQKRIATIKTDLANNITHELKTPLTSVALAIKTLRNAAFGSDEARRNELLDVLDRQNKRMQNIVDRVVESAMTNDATFSDVDVTRLLHNIATDFNSGSHNLVVSINPEKLILKTDAYMLERVIQNLLDNAKKYSGNSKEILLKSFVEHNHFVIEITDNGIGISEKELPRIFEKFYRVSTGNTHDVKGLGLGLYLSKELMKSLGGNLTAKSVTGSGSTFKIIIPLQ
ncbi:sensor histidine kinase [Polluticaenibacter yanchengensis]|uniref:histidine kinase n=1 Tax=Polluticaenibacter yanchengensis TaxID=3014562 RepID=A0ABT4UNY2_9BACT|nr:HAMP domain-containing sensor histidine kinase [Chitinophagaceae bacterium LY-5]